MPLSQIVEILNERFGTSFTATDELFWEQVRDDAVRDEALQQAGAANTRDDFAYALFILCAVRWCLRFRLSYREVAELPTERGIHVDHSTIWRWVQRYGPELDLRQRKHLKLTNRSWRVDETHVRVQGRWCYSYRAVDSEGSTIEFFLSSISGCRRPPRACSAVRCATVPIGSPA